MYRNNISKIIGLSLLLGPFAAVVYGVHIFLAVLLFFGSCVILGFCLFQNSFFFCSGHLIIYVFFFLLNVIIFCEYGKVRTFKEQFNKVAGLGANFTIRLFGVFVAMNFLEELLLLKVNSVILLTAFIIFLTVMFSQIYKLSEDVIYAMKNR